jgi:flagellar biosynthesis/type III secretory pathway M-ring protein FliF/YscJ
VNVLATASTSTSAWDQPGTLGFLVVFGMAVVLYFVFRSMARQLRKVREAARAEAEQAERDLGAQAQGQDSPQGSLSDEPFLRQTGRKGQSHRV